MVTYVCVNLNNTLVNIYNYSIRKTELFLSFSLNGKLCVTDFERTSQRLSLEIENNRNRVVLIKMSAKKLTDRVARDNELTAVV